MSDETSRQQDPNRKYYTMSHQMTISGEQADVASDEPNGSVTVTDTIEPMGRLGNADVDVDALVQAVNARKGPNPVNASSTFDHERGQLSLEGGVRLPEGDLPGFGEMGDTCGDPLWRFCSNCGDPHQLGMTCNSPTCPRCAANWARKKASNYGGWINAARRVHDATSQRRVYYQHAVASPPPDWTVDTENPQAAITKTLDLVKKIAKEMGFDFGVIVGHNYSLEKDEDLGKVHNNNDMGEWKDVALSAFDRRNGEPLDIHMDDIRERLHHRPHFHIVGVSANIAGNNDVKEFHDETGWVFHRITSRDPDQNVSIYGDYELSRVLSYVFSHSWLRDRGDHKEVVKRRFGDGWDSITVDDETEARMDQISRAVAPETLGLPYQNLTCQNELEDPTEVGLTDPVLNEENDDDQDLPEGDRPQYRTRRFGSGSFGSSESMTSKNRTDLPTKSARDRGDLPSESSGWDVPSASDTDPKHRIPEIPPMPEQRLEALRSMNRDQLVHAVDGVDYQNVFEYMEALEETEPVGETCEGRLLMIKKAPQYLDDEDWRRQAPHSDNLIGTLQEAIDEWADDPPHFQARKLLENIDDRRSNPDVDWIEQLEWDGGPG